MPADLPTSPPRAHRPSRHPRPPRAAADGDYVAILPWFLLYGLGAGMLVPLTSLILTALPTDRAGVASSVLNVSREVFGLLGVTVLGAILNTRQAAAVEAGAGSLEAFLDGYRLALVVAAVIVLVGVPVALYSLRASRTARDYAMVGSSSS